MRNQTLKDFWGVIELTAILVAWELNASLKTTVIWFLDLISNALFHPINCPLNRMLYSLHASDRKWISTLFFKKVVSKEAEITAMSNCKTHTVNKTASANHSNILLTCCYFCFYCQKGDLFSCCGNTSLIAHMSSSLLEYYNLYRVCCGSDINSSCFWECYNFALSTTWRWTFIKKNPHSWRWTRWLR